MADKITQDDLDNLVDDIYKGSTAKAPGFIDMIQRRRKGFARQAPRAPIRFKPTLPEEAELPEAPKAPGVPKVRRW